MTEAAVRPTAQHLASVQQGERAAGGLPAELEVAFPAGTGFGEVAARAQGVVDRHELLRSRLVPAPAGWSGVVQEVQEVAAVAWGPADPDGGRAGVVPGTDVDLAYRPRAGAEPARLTVRLPANAVDLGGLAVLAAELLEPPGPDEIEPVQASQHAAWQADVVAGAPAEGRDPTTALPPPLPAAGLLFEAGAGVGPTSATGVVAAEVGGEGWAAVLARAAADQVAVGDVVLAAWLVALWRFNGDRDLLVAAGVDVRTRYPDLAATVGVLSHHLPVAAELEGDTAGAALARLVAQRAAQAEAAEAFRWADVAPGAYDADARAPRAPVAFTEVVVAPGVVDHATLADPSLGARLSLQVLHDGDRARLEVRHRPDLVDPATATALLEAVVAALADVATQPELPVAEVALLSPEGVDRVLATHGHAPEPVDEGEAHAHHLFAAQVARTPDRLAVADGDRRYTYAQLDARAAQVAAALTGAGLAPGDRVAVLVDRGVDMVAAVLGAWRSGLTYVPIDPATPTDRIAYLLADSAARAVIAQPATAASLPADHPPVVDLGALDAPAGPAPVGEPLGHPRDLAYVIYTSGTTGRPKGVMIEHRSIVNLARAHRERIYRHHDPDREGMRVSFGASLAFDGAVERILLLLSGCSLFVFDDQARRDPQRYLREAREHQLHVLDVTPTFLTLLVQHGLLDEGGWRPEAVLVGGEAISPALWEDLAASPIAFYNVYGPTETTVNAAVGRVAGPAPHLGLALPGVRVHVLDPALRPVPPGVPGEVCIAGAGVARGYLNQPDLTEAKFVADPFAAGDGGVTSAGPRLYRAGDRGRFLPDGTLEFLGRTDTQVKLRGYRIETGEIAALLCADPDVDDALVRLHTANPGSPSLVAYVVAAEAAHGGLAERLRAALVAQLPDYMVPRDLLVLAGFPQTTNGKVDVAALPEPPAERRDGLSSDHVEPEGDDQLAIAAIWEAVLGLEGLGAHDNFFELGGDSLSAVAMVVQVNEAFGVDLALAAVFSAPTIAGLAATVAAELAG